MTSYTLPLPRNSSLGPHSTLQASAALLLRNQTATETSIKREISKTRTVKRSEVVSISASAREDGRSTGVVDVRGVAAGTEETAGRKSQRLRVKTAKSCPAVQAREVAGRC